ncbi:hypothetical protein AB0M95_40775 [Sphaerisporangium sp. NPDC051017]|uniref:hypothetical protein n=1 Tax=Sphaerisporangium sp. NPDC051017 TaxID=3154636 RepID=UPI00342DDC07
MPTRVRLPLLLCGVLPLIGAGTIRLAVWAGGLPAEWAGVDLVSLEQVIDGVIIVLAWWSAPPRSHPS